MYQRTQLQYSSSNNTSKDMLKSYKYDIDAKGRSLLHYVQNIIETYKRN